MLLAGRPPFESAKIGDSSYRPIAKNKCVKFWKKHKGVKISDDAKNLIEGLLCYQPTQRYTIKMVEESKWFRKEERSQTEVKMEMLRIRRVGLSNMKREAWLANKSKTSGHLVYINILALRKNFFLEKIPLAPDR
eukprot:UN12624